MRNTACKATIASATTTGSTSILWVVLLAALIHPLLSCTTILIPMRSNFLLTAASQFIFIFPVGGSCHRTGDRLMVEVGSFCSEALYRLKSSTRVKASQRIWVGCVWAPLHVLQHFGKTRSFMPPPPRVYELVVGKCWCWRDLLFKARRRRINNQGKAFSLDFNLMHVLVL